MANDNADFNKIMSSINDDKLARFDRILVELDECRIDIERDYSNWPVSKDAVNNLREAAKLHRAALNAELEAHNAAERAANYRIWERVWYGVLDLINFISGGRLERSKFIQSL